MKKINVNDIEYEIIVNERDAINVEMLSEMLTEYFEDYRYILGDWAYGKLRLKGFRDANDERVNELNNVEFYSEYVKKYCAYGCRYFLIKRV